MYILVLCPIFCLYFTLDVCVCSRTHKQVHVQHTCQHAHARKHACKQPMHASTHANTPMHASTHAHENTAAYICWFTSSALGQQATEARRGPARGGAHHAEHKPPLPQGHSSRWPGDLRVAGDQQTQGAYACEDRIGQIDGGSVILIAAFICLTRCICVRGE